MYNRLYFRCSQKFNLVGFSENVENDPFWKFSKSLNLCQIRDNWAFLKKMMAQFLSSFRNSCHKPRIEPVLYMLVLCFRFVTGRNCRKRYEFWHLGLRNHLSLQLLLSSSIKGLGSTCSLEMDYSTEKWWILISASKSW